MKRVDILIITILVVASIQGVRNETRSKGRIVGQDAVDGQFPYAVFLEVFHEDYYLECTGSFLAPQWILSSTKCIDGMDYAIVYLGSILRHTGEVAYTVYPSELKVHPNWDIDSDLNYLVLICVPTTDICLNVFPVPLPEMNSRQVSYDGHIAIASGWNEFGDKLQWTRVIIMASEECAAAHGYDYINGFICSYASSLQCSAHNFGAPLISEDLGVIIGVHSSNIRYNGACVMIYMRIGADLLWIKEITGL